MIYKPRRQSAAMMALLVFFFSVFPAKRSQAVVPLVGMAVAALGPGGTVVSADLLASGVTALIGGTIVAIGLSPSTADAPVRVPLVSDKPTIDGAMPPPAVAATTAGTAQSNAAACAAKLALLTTTSTPSGCTVTTTYTSNGVSSYAGQYYGCGYNRITSTTTAGCESTWNRTYNNDGTYSWYQATPNVVCPAGYTQSGSSCNLSDARAAASDGKADLNRSASGFSVNASEKDSLPSYATVSNNKVYASGVDSSGRPVMIEYAVSSDGTKTYITHYTQTEDGSQTVVKTQNITVDAASGAVVNASASSAVGSISPATSAGATPTVSTGAAVTSGTSSGSSSIVFPSDYARAGEAASAANIVKGSVEEVRDKLADSVTVDDPTVPDWADNWGATFNPLKGWSVPGHSSVCPVGSFDWNGSTYTINSHCQLISDYWSALQSAAVVLWTVLALFILLGA